MEIFNDSKKLLNPIKHLYMGHTVQVFMSSLPNDIVMAWLHTYTVQALFNFFFHPAQINISTCTELTCQYFKHCEFFGWRLQAAMNILSHTHGKDSQGETEKKSICKVKR